MDALQISVICNVGLVVLLVCFLWMQPQRLRQAKLATFAEMLAAISYGAAHKDAGVRFERMSFGLARMLGGIETGEIRWRLLRAAMIGYLGSGRPALADLLDGEGRLVVLKSITGDAKADEVWAYVDRMLEDPAPLLEQIDPTEVFTGEDLKLAQLQLEAGLLRFYEAALRRTKD